MCPLLTDDELFAFIIPSPKQADLFRDGRYTLHSFPCEDNEDAFSVSGHARLEEDPSTRHALEEQFVRERKALGVPTPEPDHALFRFDIEACLLTRTTGTATPLPSTRPGDRSLTAGRRPGRGSATAPPGDSYLGLAWSRPVGVVAAMSVGLWRPAARCRR
jgi:hypothetical protein